MKEDLETMQISWTVARSCQRRNGETRRPCSRSEGQEERLMTWVFGLPCI